MIIIKNVWWDLMLMFFKHEYVLPMIDTKESN